MFSHGNTCNKKGYSTIKKNKKKTFNYMKGVNRRLFLAMQRDVAYAADFLRLLSNTANLN